MNSHNSNEEFVLPLLVELSDFGGDWDVYKEELYRIFRGDFLGDQFVLDTKPIRVRHAPKYDEKVSAFWHVISDGKIEEDRTPDVRRCERIKWIRYILERKDSNFVNSWKEERSTTRGLEERLCIALPDFSYLVVIQERDRYWLLLTAYPVKYESQRARMRSKYEKALG